MKNRFYIEVRSKKYINDIQWGIILIWLNLMLENNFKSFDVAAYLENIKTKKR